MCSKRRQSIKREGYRNYCPGFDPEFKYNGKVLQDQYDRKCYLEGHDKADDEHLSQLKHEQEEKEFLNEQS